MTTGAVKGRRRLWRYEVTEVEGDAPVKVGQVVIDRWKPDRAWHIYNLETMTFVGGWTGKLLGEVTEPEILEQVDGLK